MGLSEEQRYNHAKITSPRLAAEIKEMELELKRLRDQVRWKKWPEEKPDDNDGIYAVLRSKGDGTFFESIATGHEILYYTQHEIYFKALGPMPEVDECGK